MRFALTLATLALTAVPASALAQVQPMLEMQGDAPLLTLAITESIDAKPDTATIGAGVQTIAPTATAALRQNSAKMDALIKAVKARGVDAKDIQTTGISLSPQYDYNNRSDGQSPRFIGYQVSNEVRVKTRDIAK
ncbi:MAG: SIMPL domain-containing protein, partial [Sphingomonadales bacterium]|nr:SIMPL domain-containing protein [Sphingomonadales bacterium]